MYQISNKLHQLRSSIRKEQLTTLMKKTREDIQRSDEETFIREISNTPLYALTSQQVSDLIQLANRDITGAIILLGNLVIDRFLGEKELQTVEWQLGDSEHWPWLIHAFAEIGYCTSNMFQLCLKRITAKKSAFSLTHALEVLLKSFKMSQTAMQEVRHRPELILAISNHVVQGNETVTKLSLTIFSSLTSEDQAMPQYILECLGEARTTEMMMQGLMKMETIHRALTCQIANNFLMSGIGLERVCRKIMEQALGEKDKVKLEISYYLKAFVDTAHIDFILDCIKRHKLLQILKAFSQAATLHPKLGCQIADNAVKTLAAVRQRFSQCDSEHERQQVLHHVEKMLDDSEAQTIYEDESARMIE